jgi:hypothetical protein
MHGPVRNVNSRCTTANEMDSDQGVELAIVLLALLIYVAYHIQYFFVRPWLRQRYTKRSRHTAVFFASRWAV